MKQRDVFSGMVLSFVLCVAGTIATGQGGEAAKPATPPSNKKSTSVPAKRSTPAARSGRTNSKTSSSQAQSNRVSAAEIAFWESIKNSTDIADFQAYLRKYPNGEFVDIAQNRISSVETSAREKAERERTDRARKAETGFWESIKSSTNPEDFRAYLNNYPNGEFADLAKSRIAGLESSRTGASTKTSPVKVDQPKAAARNVATGTKIAIIDSKAFYDQANGIARLTRAVEQVGREFKPRADELHRLRQRRDALANEINQTKNVADPSVVRDKTGQLNSLDREITFKSGECDDAYIRRTEQILSPQLDDINKFAQKLATQRGLEMVIDASKEEVPSNAKATDITRDVIAEYNRANPLR